MPAARASHRRSYNFISTAISNLGERSKEAMVGQVTTPNENP